MDNFGLKGTFITFGVIFGIFLPLLSLVFHNPKSNEVINTITSTDNGNKEITNIMETRNFWLLYINFIIGTTVGLMIIATSGIIGSNYYDIEIHVIALIVSFFAICNSIVRPVFGALNDRIGTKKVIAVIHIITIISSLIIIFQPLNNFMNYVLGLSLAWMMLGAWLAVAPAATHNLFAEENYSKNYGIIFTGYGVGAIICVLFSGRIIDANLSIAFIFTPVIVLSFISQIITKIYLKTSQEKKA
ncbi:MAG: MFS transporter [Candidatus Izemoplasmatales bacterium]|nr:MFS transporter [Candidatus Izemoplasmatales bacterium]